MEAGQTRNEEITKRAAVHAALGDPVRLAIVDALALSDRSPQHLAQWLELDSNLLSHHLDVLERSGLIDRIASSGDRRRKYVRMNQEILQDLFPDTRLSVNNLLFLCTRNSARSQLAAALWNAKAQGLAESAGTHPASCVHPMAVEVAALHGIDLTETKPRPLASVTIVPDLVITVCDRAYEELAPWEVSKIHWSIPDPAEIGTNEAFNTAFEILDSRISLLSEVCSKG